MASMRAACSTSPCIDGSARKDDEVRAFGGVDVKAPAHAVARESCAQATVEAAMLIPCFLTLMLLALQPVCLFYTVSVMESAAGETARVAATRAPGDEDGDGDGGCEAFALRRLAAVPDVPIFHAGGAQAWGISVEGDGSGEVRVAIEGSVEPLPVLGAFVPLFGERDGHGNVRLEVEVVRGTRPDWVEGGYDAWVGMWD